MASRPAPDHFQEGIDLFNAGRFFQCHEAWEQLWLRAGGADKRFYQGLIQAAVAILHAERGNRAGARSLYAKARAKLEPLPDEYGAVALKEFRDALREFFALALAPDASRLPRRPKLRRTGSRVKRKR
jgi:uncharacterized protein